MRTEITLGIRDFGHFSWAFLTAFFVAWQAGGFPIHTSALYALAPGAATVAYRQVFPNPKPAKAPAPPAPPAA